MKTFVEAPVKTFVKTRTPVLLLGFGDLAKRLSAKLLKHQSSYQISAIKRSPITSPPAVDMPAVDMYYGDASDPVFLSAVLSSIVPQIIFISLTPDLQRSDSQSALTDDGREAIYRQAYLATLENLLTQLNRLDIRPHIIWSSSTSVYGQNQGQWIDELSEAVPLKPSAKVLVASENALMNSRFNNTIIRFSGLYDGVSKRSLAKIRLYQENDQPPESERQWSNRLHRDDAAGFVAFLIEKLLREEKINTLYLASDNCPVPRYLVTDYLAAKLFGYAVPERKIQSLSGKRCINQQMLSSGYVLQYADYKAGYSSTNKQLH